jgi:two-component system sensor histidine kinase DegS
MENFQEETGIRATLKARGTCEGVRSVVSLSVFRVVQEALSNVKKHAQAVEVAVHAEFMKDLLRLLILDDGQGFNINDVKNRTGDINGGFGLISMRERVELLNGEFRINSEVGKGTRLYISIPLMQEEDRTNE